MSWMKLRSATALVLAAAVVLGGLVAVEPASAADSIRDCNDLNAQLTARQQICVNGATVGTRGRFADACLAQVDWSREKNYAYENGTCSTVDGKVQGERIAQARFIQYLDLKDLSNWGLESLQPGHSQRAIHPGAQWETVSKTDPGKYADVINYKPDFYGASNPSTKPMDLWELKVATGTTKSREKVLQTAAKEAEQYAETLKNSQGQNRSQSLWNSIRAANAEAFTDTFSVKKSDCNDRDARGSFVKTETRHRFDVSQSSEHAGAIVVERTVEKYDCEEGKRRDNDVDQTEEPYSIGQPNTVDLITTAIICALAPGICVPSESVEQPAEKVPAFSRSELFATDATGVAYWREKGPEYCAALASAELTKNITHTPVANACDDASNFSDLFQNASFLAFLKTLDVASLRVLLDVLFDSYDQDGSDNVSTPARVNGDPHLVTLDGLNYDMQSVGEFDLLSVPERAISVQARFAAAGTQSSVVAVVTSWADHTIEMHADGTVLLDGEAITISPGTGITFDDEDRGYFLNDNGTYRMSWPAEEESGTAVELSWQPINAALGSIGVQVPPSIPTVGLLGNNDGDPLNDLRTRSGVAVDASNAVDIHDAYADSWRVRNASSDFSYGPGQSTGTFTDRSFPQQILTTGDFPITEQVSAQQACEAAGVVAGPAFGNCVLDVLVTRNNDFAVAFAGATESSRSADDKVMSADGKLSETFATSSIAPNFSPLRVSQSSEFGTTAGPFGGAEQYRFHVPDMPKHDEVTVAFDLLAFGQWDTADAVAVRIDAQAPAPVDLSTATLGVLSDGTPVRTKRVSMPFEHYRDLVSVALAGSGLSGPQRFAVDNIDVSARVVAPQTFSVQLQPGVSAELRAPALATGSGVLESWGARDQYATNFNHQDVLLDWQTRSSTIKWSVANASTGKVVASGLSADGNQRLRNLSGSYVVTVEASGEIQPTSEAYSLNLLVTPEAERFEFELPGPVQLPLDLPSPAVANGAGSLETKLSTDLYDFTVKGTNRQVTIDPTLCPSLNYRQRLSWTLLDANQTVVDSGNCWSRTVTGLNAGDYSLRVDPEREAVGAYRITVTQAGPTVAFSPLPAEASNKRNQTLSFAGSDDARAFQCALDAPSYTGPFMPCASPATFSDLADGDHTIQVRAKDSDGNLGPAIKHHVTVDTLVPNLQITRKPPAQSNINGPVLEYSADKEGMTYQCSLVPVGSAPSLSDCYGASVYRDLKHGTYRFTVLGTDWVGNESTISYDFMVDLEPPVITLTPASNLTSTASPQFTFTANETATYECSLVPAAQTDNFIPCTSPKQYSGLIDGTQYRFLVKATDVAGQWSARGVTWTPYATPPSVTITSKPAGSSTNAAPSFAFTSNMTNPTFECSLELAAQASAFTPCGSPKTYGGKGAGTYKFVVKATDATGSWVSSSYQFAITAPSGDTQAPTTPGTASAVISPAGAALGADTDTPASGIPVRISWPASSDNVGVAGYQLQYSTNGGAFTVAGNVTGTSVTLNVPAGSSTWRYQVRAYDAAGNLSTASTASTAITLGLDQETVTSRVTFAGTWTTASAGTSSGGATKYASASTASATYKPVAGTNQIAVVMATGPAAGRASVAIDGGTATTIDLYSSSPGVRSITFSSATLSATVSHTVVIKPLGTKSASSSGTRVDIDGFLTRK